MILYRFARLTIVISFVSILVLRCRRDTRR